MKRILLADDTNNDLMLLLRDMLSSYDVKIVNNAARLLQEVKGSRYDLIISDNNMGPEYEDTGTYVAEVIRREDNHTPFILLTGVVNKEVILFAIKAGINEEDIFEKTNIPELMKRVNHYLK